MKNIRLFETVAEFEAVKASLATPNVSLAGNKVFYLPALGPEPGPVYEMVDLGLSVKWAKCNVGAEKESDYGMYFKWGDTIGHDRTHCNHDNSIPTVEVDSNNHLLPAYDAATVNMGESYRMPTSEEIEELINGTDHAVMTIDGVPGMCYSKKGDVNTYIFVPFAGICEVGDFADEGDAGGVWSSTPGEGDYTYANRLICNSDNRTFKSYSGCSIGYTVRAVCA